MRMLWSSKFHTRDRERSTVQLVLQLTFCCSIKVGSVRMPRTSGCVTVCMRPLQVACGLLAASIHRRHVFSWSMFVPRCMYEAVAFGVTQVLLLIAWAVVV